VRLATASRPFSPEKHDRFCKALEISTTKNKITHYSTLNQGSRCCKHFLMGPYLYPQLQFKAMHSLNAPQQKT
jgi:hypothetical protein